jgi:hypothetical protein
MIDSAGIPEAGKSEAGPSPDTMISEAGVISEAGIVDSPGQQH